MITSDSTARILAAIPELTVDTLKFARQSWTKTNPMRQILACEADRLTDVLRNSLESCKPEELADLQGQIKGIKALLAAANAQGDL